MTNSLTINFYGVRGSLASPGACNALVGGNTSCVEVCAGGRRIVFDAGSGLRNLGDSLMKEGPSKTTILLSHLHWDHIQGLPFFSPLYVPGNRIEVMSGPNGYMNLRDALRKQMSPPFFPVSLDDVATQLCVRDLRPSERFNIGDIRVTTAKLNHPDPVYGYRLDFGGRSVVYATDTEHYSCVDPTLLRLAEGADVLIYDAQYTPEEYSGIDGPPKVGWGHSTYSAAAELANLAGVGRLVLFHHDPKRNDDAVQEIQTRCRLAFPDTVAAREGMSITLQQNQGDTSLVYAA
ncbi:MAG: MBL fold metallo-hydrolase [Kofleriaceae bacterium]|nr:MBL fold metallo-hydrolase [Kofleriaceae bacterium]